MGERPHGFWEIPKMPVTGPGQQYKKCFLTLLYSGDAYVPTNVDRFLFALLRESKLLQVVRDLLSPF